MRHITLPFLVMIGLSACTTPPKAIPVAAAPTPKAKIHQDYLKPRDIKRVRTGEFVKTYHVGRSVKGRGGSTMHESHRVYRLEKPSRWNLFRDQPPLASTGPVNKIVDSAYKPAPESKAIQAELNHQRELTAQLEQARRDLVGAVEQTRHRLAETAERTERARSDHDELKRLRAENEALKLAQANTLPLPDPPSILPGDALKRWGDKLDSKKE